MHPFKTKNGNVKPDFAGKMMKYRIIIGSLAAASTLLFSVNSNAVVINHSTFLNNGGNLANIHSTLEDAYTPLRAKSYSPRFDAVGKIYACTATWLGDSKDGKKAYILTAAHCAEFHDPSASSGTYTGQFRDRHNRVIAENGTYYLGPYRIQRPAGFGGASTDIAILALNKKANMLDDHGKAINPPWIYDGVAEKGARISMVGYGNWGTGEVSPQSTPDGEQFVPDHGTLRAWGESYVDAIWEKDHGMSAPYHPEHDAKAWARLAPGDSGAAWWQQHQGFWSVVGVTNSGSMHSSNAARTSQYVHWIKSVYPEARTLSGMTTINAREILTLPDLSKETAEGSVAYTVPKQSNASGPTIIDWDLGPGFSEIQLNLKEVTSGKRYQVTLRAWRDVGCGKAPINIAVSCGDKQSSLVMKYYPEDNQQLPPGHYKGVFYVQAQGWHDKSYTNRLTLMADIDNR
jgi:hypothetical protein